MRAEIFLMTRIWAMLTGLALAGWFFGELSLGLLPSQTVIMLVTAIGGFELVLFGQDLWLNKRRSRTHG